MGPCKSCIVTRNPVAFVLEIPTEALGEESEGSGEAKALEGTEGEHRSES